MLLEYDCAKKGNGQMKKATKGNEKRKEMSILRSGAGDEAGTTEGDSSVTYHSTKMRHPS